VRSGLEVMERIGVGRASPPVILIVSCAVRTTVQRCERAGAAALLDRRDIERSLVLEVETLTGGGARAAA